MATVQLSIREQLAQQIDRLTEEQQKRLLETAKAIARPKGIPGSALLKFAGRIPADDVERMEKAIEDCEQIDPDGW